MNNKILIRLFLCLALAQLSVPAAMIFKREMILKQGEQFKFKAAPVDPYDAFRGRYVALSLEETSVPAEKGMSLNYGQTVYALISVDEKGFAKFSGVALKPPPDRPYLRATVRYTGGDKVNLKLPIDRYYMEENAAPKAENIYRKHARRENKDAYVIVRVRGGVAVIESLYVGGQRIEDAVKAQKGS